MRKMGRFNLEQLAHFDRCLFPDDLAEDIGRLGGYTPDEILLMKLDFRQWIKKTPLSVVGLFQENIQNERFCKALEALLLEFCEKHYYKNYILTIETDFDFSIKLNGKVHHDMTFSIAINDPKELDEIVVGGPFGTGGFVPLNEAKGHVYELKRGLERIKANPNETFDELGGNRGVAWQVIKG